MDLSSNLEILGVSPVKAPGGTHTIYAIRCRSNGKTWTMYDRYSNIRRIYDVAKVTHPYVSGTQGGKVDFPPKHAIPGQKTDLYRAEALLLWLSTYSYIPAVSKFLRPMDGCGGSGRAISPSSLRSSSETVRERAETNSRSSRSSCSSPSFQGDDSSSKRNVGINSEVCVGHDESTRTTRDSRDASADKQVRFANGQEEKDPAEGVSVDRKQDEDDQGANAELSTTLHNLLLSEDSWFSNMHNRMREGEEKGQGHIKSVSLRGKAEQWLLKPEEVVIGKRMGQGDGGVIYMAKWRGLDVVAKMLRSEEEADGNISREVARNDLLNEICVLSHLRHPCLVMFLGAVLSGDSILILNEYMPGGNLEEFFLIRQRAQGYPWCPPMEKVLQLGIELGRALGFLHNCNPPVIHRDLKPANLLLSSSGKLKVCDFGLSRVKNGFRHGRYRMTGKTGSLRYMAPEVFQQDPSYDERVDIYSFAMILHFICNGVRPLPGLSGQTVALRAARDGARPPLDAILSQRGAPLAELIRRSWSTAPSDRPTALEMLQELEIISMWEQTEKVRAQRLSTEQQAVAHALYHRATVGRCTQAKPAKWRMFARMCWKRWVGLEMMEREEAKAALLEYMKHYCDVTPSLTVQASILPIAGVEIGDEEEQEKEESEHDGRVKAERGRGSERKCGEDKALTSARKLANGHEKSVRHANSGHAKEAHKPRRHGLVDVASTHILTDAAEEEEGGARDRSSGGGGFWYCPARRLEEDEESQEENSSFYSANRIRKRMESYDFEERFLKNSRNARMVAEDEDESESGEEVENGGINGHEADRRNGEGEEELQASVREWHELLGLSAKKKRGDEEFRFISPSPLCLWDQKIQKESQGMRLFATPT